MCNQKQSKPSLVEDMSLSLETHSITCTNKKADVDIQHLSGERPWWGETRIHTWTTNQCTQYDNQLTLGHTGNCLHHMPAKSIHGKNNSPND
jgi:hypothetical protein